MSQRLQSIVRNSWLGLVMVVVASAAALLLTTVWDVSSTWYDWRTLTVGILILEVMLLVGIEELGRTQNPYRHLDPRFAFLDAAPSGTLESASSAWLWHALPPAIVIGIIAASWLVM